MSDWQLIETAPKDGTAILSWDGQFRVVIAWSTRDKGWFLCDDERGDWADVTHWMPLPAPPITPAERNAS
jgi:hypothetical protein